MFGETFVIGINLLFPIEVPFLEPGIITVVIAISIGIVMAAEMKKEMFVAEKDSTVIL